MGMTREQWGICGKLTCGLGAPRSIPSVESDATGDCEAETMNRIGEAAPNEQKGHIGNSGGKYLGKCVGTRYPAALYNDGKACKPAALHPNIFGMFDFSDLFVEVVLAPAIAFCFKI